MKENPKFLEEQIITYIGNKRQLNTYIEKLVIKIKADLQKDKLFTLDLFSGSGVVSRMLKKHSSKLIANDLEAYSKVINDCYLTNQSDFNEIEYDKYYQELSQLIDNKDYTPGLISKFYSPKDDKNILEGERCFYTTDNALRIDTIRHFIDTLEEPMKTYFLAPLLYQASVNTNTSGVFKGFYKDKTTGIGKFGGYGENALTRIKKEIIVLKPIFSNYECDVDVLNKDANQLVKDIHGLDVVYMDPPYNQHPYASNYFMLNLIVHNKMPKQVSKVSGIPKDWNRSVYNNKRKALKAFDDLLKHIESKYLIISYNSEGIIGYDEMLSLLEKYGEVSVESIEYNTFRGSRNLNGRSLYVNEYLFVVKKG